MKKSAQSGGGKIFKFMFVFLNANEVVFTFENTPVTLLVVFVMGNETLIFDSSSLFSESCAQASYGNIG